MRVIFHIDLNAFFASAEEIKNPTLKGKPIAVCGHRKHGVITTANYEARKYGVKSAMPVFEALKKCSDLILVSTDFNFYEKLSNQFFAYIKTISPFVEIASIDECYVDVSMIQANKIELALKIQKEIKQKLGLDCSIGIAPNKFLAKMASDMKKPCGITILRKKEVMRKLWPLKIEEMYGIGKKSASKLKEIGIYTIKDLANFENMILLKKILGQNALILKNNANGIDHNKINYLETDLKTVGNSITLNEETTNFDLILETLKSLSKQVSERMKHTNQYGKRVQITIKYHDLKQVCRSSSVGLTNDYNDIFSIVIYLFEQIDLDKPIRLVGVSVNDLVLKDNFAKQLDLFSYQNDDSKTRTKQIVKEINNKLKTNKLMIAQELIKKNDQ